MGLRTMLGSPARRAVAAASICLCVVLLGFWLYGRQKQRNTLALLNEARRAESAGDWTAAAMSYRRYLRREPADTAALRAYSNVLFERLKTAPEVLGDTLAVLRNLVTADPADTEALGKLSNLYLLLKEHRSAEELAIQWREQSPDSIDAVSILARAKIGLGNSHEALALLSAFLEKAPTSAALYPLILEILTKELKQPEEAERWLAQGLRLLPQDAGIQLCAFLIHQARGDRAQAEVHLRRAVENGPDSLAVLLAAGQFHLAAGDFAEASPIVERARRLAPEDRRALTLWAVLVQSENDPETMASAAQELQRVAGATDAELLYLAAELHEQAGQFERTDQCLSMLEAIPNIADRLGSRVDTLRGTREVSAGRPLAAIGFLLRALERDAESVPALRALARAYMHAGDLDAANETCRHLVAIRPQDAAVRFVMADLAWRQSRFADTRLAVADLSNPTDSQRALISLIGLAASSAETDGHAPASTSQPGAPNEELRALAEQDALAALWLVRYWVWTDRMDDAIEFWRSQSDGGPNAAALGSEIGRLLLGRQRWDAASAFAEELLHHDPNSMDGHRLRVVALASSGRAEEVRRIIESGSLPGGVRSVLLESLGDHAITHDQPEAALAMYREAADGMPQSVTARQKIVQCTANLAEADQRSQEWAALEGAAGFQWKFGLAGALIRLDPGGDGPRKAAVLLQECLARRPRWGAARLMLGQTLELLGQRYEAAEAYQTALAQQPALRTSLAALRLAELLMRLGRLFEAQSLLSGLVTALPTEPRVLQLWMEQQIRRKEFDSARATADHLLAMQPENPVWPALQADLLLREGKAAEAEALIRAALTEKPAAIPLLASLARVLFIQKRPDEAEQVVREAAAQSEDVAHQFLLTSVYLMLGRRTEAEAILKNLEATANQDANIWAACSENWGRLGRRDRQLAAARKSLSLLGEDPAVSLRLARILMQGGTADEVQEAAMLVQIRLGQNPNDKAARVLAARIVLLRNPPNLAEAEQALEEILARDPLWTEARSLLCSVQLARGRSEAARSTIRVGLAITPDDPALLLASAQVHYAVSENIAVIQTTSRLLESQPRALQALLLLASAYERSGRALEAIEVISRHFSEDLATPEEISILAGLHESASNFDQAERLRRRACELDPPGGEAYHDLIHFFARRRDYAQIRALAEEHAARHPRDFQSLAAAAEALSCACTEPAFREVGERWFDQLAGEESDGAADVLYRSARCFYQCEELDRAEARFLESIRRRPTHRPAVNDLSWLYAEDLSRPQEALMIIERFTAGGGELDGHLLDTRGLAYLNLRQWEAAEQSLNAGLRIADSPRTRTSATYHLGLVYWNVGRKAEAASYMRQATHLDGQFGGLSVKQRSKVREVLDGGDAPG